MRFARIDEVDAATRIAGPAHHRPGIEPGEATPDDVRRRVSLGLARAGHGRRSALSIERIRHAPDDAWSPTPYEESAYALAMRASEPGRPEMDLDRG